MASGYAGVIIGSIPLTETGPDTGVFTGSSITINQSHMVHAASGLENQFIQAVCASGCGGSAFTQANLIQPPPPEPEPEPEPTPAQTQYTTSSADCPAISNWELEDWSRVDRGTYDRLECHYFDHDSNLSPRSSLTSHIFTTTDAAKGISSCSGEWHDNYAQGELYSSSHHLNVYYAYDDDDNYDTILSAARNLLSKIESSGDAVRCDAQTTQQEPEPEPVSTPTTTPTPTPTQDPSEETSREQQAIDDAKRIEEFNQMMAQKAQQEKMDQLDEYIAKGDQAFDSGNYDQAILFYNKANKIIPSNEITEKIRESEDLLVKKATNQQTVLQNNPGIAIAESKISQAEEQTGKGNPSEAIRLYREALDAMPTDEVEERGFISLAIHNAQIDLADKIKSKKVIFDPNVIDKFNNIGYSPKDTPPLPTVGKGSHEDVVIIRDGKMASSAATLNVGDVVLVGANTPPFVIDWGHATTTIQPGSSFLIGKPDQLRSFASGTGDANYIELVEGQIRTYDFHKTTKDQVEFQADPERETCYLVKTGKNLTEVCSDVTFSLDETTGVYTIKVDEGTVKVYDVITDSIKEYGAGTILETNDDGYYFVKTAAAQESDTVEAPSSGGGCLIATATYGTELAPQVQFLRELRDNTLLQTSSGTAFMTGFNQVYYSFSPGIADLERENPVFLEAVKLTITPMISSLSLLNYVEINSDTEMLGYGISLIVLNIGMYFVAPAILIITIKKKSQ